MSNSQRFDEHIKEQFQDYTPQVHPRIWDNIIKEREKRRPAGFWFNFLNSRNILLIAGLFIATATGAYFLINNSSGIRATGIATTTKQKQQEYTPTKRAQNNTTITETSVNTDKVTTTLTNNDNTSDLNNNSSTPASLYVNKGSSKIKTTPQFTADDGLYQIAGSKIKTHTLPDTDYDISDADMVTGNDLLQTGQLTKLYFLAEKSASEKEALALRQRLSGNVNLPGCPSIEKDAAGNKRYVEIYGGPDLAFRNLSDTGNSAYLQKRKESTSFTSAYSAGVRYTQVFNNSMSIRTGINFSQINEKFTTVQGNLVQVTYIINANGDTTGTFITTGTRYKTTHNKFRTIDVPLVVGYELGNGRIHANINAGVIINAYSWQKGEVLDTSFNPVSINTGKASSPYQFKTNIGVGFVAGVSFYYKLNEKVHVLAEPYFRYNLTPMSKENLTFKQKYNTAGVRLGLRIDLH